MIPPVRNNVSLAPFIARLSPCFLNWIAPATAYGLAAKG
jgi:hypothetical protein